jgi:tetratricopeptide (TPR) repeat protein
LAVRDHNDRLRAERRFQELRSFANFAIHDLDKAMSEGATPARATLAKKAVGYLDGLAAEAGNDVALKKDLIAGYLQVADIQGNLHTENLGQAPAALESIRKAVSIADSFSPRDLTDPSVQSAVANCQEKLADLLGIAGDRTAALQHYRKALDAGRQEPIPTYRILAKIAQTQADSGDPAAALESYRGCEHAALEMQSKNPDDALARNLLALAHERIAWFSVQAGEPAGAEEKINAAIATYKGMSPTPRARRNLAMAYKTMASVQQRAGKSAEALLSSRQSLDISEALADKDPRNDQFQIDLAQEKVQWLDLLIRNGQIDEARKQTALTLALLKPKAHTETPSLYYLTDYLAILVGTPFRDLAQSDDAVPLARRGVSLTKGKDSETLDLLAKALFKAGNREEAITTEKQALSLLPPTPPGKQPAEPRRTLEEALASMEDRPAPPSRR